MRTRAQYRPRISNGQVPKRRASAPRGSQTTRRRSATRSRRQSESRPLGTQILLMLIGVGAVFAAIFVFALRWQSTAYRTSQEEVTLRSALDTAADERRQLTLEQTRALSPQETEQRGLQAGLSPYKLDPRASYAQAPPAPVSPKTPAKAAKTAVKSAPPLAKTVAKSPPAKAVPPRAAPTPKPAAKAQLVQNQKRH